MKILQINCVYNKGSTGKIVADIHKQLIDKGYESIVCYGRGAKVKDAHVYKTCGELYSKFQNLVSRLTGLMYGGCYFSTRRLIKIIKKEKPNVVHLHCLNGYFVNIYKLIEWLKKSNLKTVLTLHAEFMHTANCGHAFECDKWKTGCGNCPRLKKETKSILFDKTNKSWLKMKKSFDGFDNLKVVSVSPWLMERAKQSPILSDKKHIVVLNGLDIDVFKIYDTNELKKNLSLENEKILFHATPNFNANPQDIKGGYYVLKLAEKLLDRKDVRVVVAGAHPKELNVPSNVVLLGRVSNQELLAKYYSMADVAVLASKKETFSMVVAESLCCGTPIVGFKAGAPEQITIKEYSDFVEYGDINELFNKVFEFIDKKIDKIEIAEIARKKYNKNNMIDGYVKLYEE